jgi:hypothetical protein
VWGLKVRLRRVNIAQKVIFEAFRVVRNPKEFAIEQDVSGRVSGGGFDAGLASCPEKRYSVRRV